MFGPSWQGIFFPYGASSFRNGASGFLTPYLDSPIGPLLPQILLGAGMAFGSRNSGPYFLVAIAGRRPKR